MYGAFLAALWGWLLPSELYSGEVDTRLKFTMKKLDLNWPKDNFHVEPEKFILFMRDCLCIYWCQISKFRHSFD